MDSIDIVLFLEGHAYPQVSPKHGAQWSEYHSRLGVFWVFEFFKTDGWKRVDGSSPINRYYEVLYDG